MPAGVTADIRCLATGHMATVNQCRLKFLEAVRSPACPALLLATRGEGGAGGEDRCRCADSAGLAYAPSAAPERDVAPVPCLGLGIQTKAFLFL